MLPALKRRRFPTWLPTDLGAGLKLWLPSDAAAITVATGVSQWDDYSGNGNDFVQAVGSKQPAHNSTGGPNSTSIVTFDGTDDDLYVVLALASMISLSAYAVIAVVRIDTQPDAGSDNADATCYDNEHVISDGAAGYWGTALRRTNNRFQSWHFSTVTEVVGTDASTSTWYRLRVEYDGTDITHKLGSAGIQTDAGAGNIGAGSSASTLIKLGSNYANADYAAISIAEVMVLNRALTPDERTSIDSYITSKFGSGLV